MGWNFDYKNLSVLIYAFCELQVFVPPKKRRQQYFFVPENIDKYKVLNTNQQIIWKLIEPSLQQEKLF